MKITFNIPTINIGKVAHEAQLAVHDAIAVYAAAAITTQTTVAGVLTTTVKHTIAATTTAMSEFPETFESWLDVMMELPTANLILAIPTSDYIGDTVTTTHKVYTNWMETYESASEIIDLEPMPVDALKEMTSAIAGLPPFHDYVAFGDLLSKALPQGKESWEMDIVLAKVKKAKEDAPNPFTDVKAPSAEDFADAFETLNKAFGQIHVVDETTADAETVTVKVKAEEATEPEPEDVDHDDYW